MRDGPPVLEFRLPGYWGVGVFLAIVYVVGAAAVIWSVSDGGFDPSAAQGAAWPCAIATIMTAALTAPHVRRGEVRYGRTIALRAALAWGVVGAAWPLANTLADLIVGAPLADPLILLAFMGVGAVFGVAGGLSGGAAGALAALRRRA